MSKPPPHDRLLADSDYFERRVLRLDEMTDAELEEILSSNIPEEYSYYTANIPD